MKVSFFFVFLLTLCFAQKGGAVDSPKNVLSLGFDQVTWTFTSQGKYLLVEDPRALRQVYHPWDISQDGDFASLSAKVTVPAKWQGPIFLNLYANDTYVSEGWDQVKSKWTHTYASYHNFVGHRFKQVLIDDQVAWEQDVGDAEEFDYFSLDISKWAKPGQTFTLTLRVLDQVGSGTKSPGDEFHLGIWSWDGLGDPDAEKKFYTRVFWGDVALSAGVAVPWDQNPARKEVALHPVRPAASGPVQKASGGFLLDCPEGLPEDGYPVTWGIPFGQGRLLDEKRVALAGPDGRSTPVQTRVLHKWPDGSVHWLLMDFQADGKSAGQTYTVTYGTEVSPASAQNGLRVKQTGGGVSVDTGALRFEVKPGARLAEGITLAGEQEALGQELVGEVVARDGWVSTRFVAVSEKVVLEADGPERATVLCSGYLADGDKKFGRFTCRIHAYRGRPYLRTLFRVFNDTDAPAQLVEEFLVRLKTPLTDAEAILGDQRLKTREAETGRLLVRQYKCDAYEVFEGSDARRTSGAHWQGPVTLQGGGRGVSGQVRYFAQQYPKRMWAGQGGQMVFDLFTRTVEYEQYVMTRGEAKRHELLLYFHKGESPKVQAAFKTFETPPVLMSPDWYAEQQAFGWGAALTPERFPKFHQMMMERGRVSLACTVPNGLRNWPDSYSDSIYNAYRGTWSNMYQEVDYGAYILAMLAGQRAWFDYAEAYQGHFMDIDICHHHADPAWVGASYGISPYHTGHAPYSLNAPLAGLFLLHYLTGDSDAREAAVGIGDWLYATNTGVGARSGRAVGWPLRSSMIAYENTYDPKHLQAGRQLAESALSALRPRRQFFSESTATWQYRGGVPTMNAILAAGLMRYWRATGDERVGRALAHIAYNMAYSWMSPTEPGMIMGADPLQSVYLAGYSMQDILPLFWGYELTGDGAFLKKGMQVMQGSILAERNKGSAFGLSRYWEMQDILHWMRVAQEAGF